MWLRKNSINSKRALSKGYAHRTYQKPSYPIKQTHIDNQSNRESRKHTKDKILAKIEKLTDAEIDKISQQLDKITGNDHSQKPEEFDLEAEEVNDGVNDLPQDEANENKYRSVSEISEYGSRTKDRKSISSQRSSKTYISALKKELDIEREERMKLEQEIKKLKKLSSEISSKLGINIK